MSRVAPVSYTHLQHIFEPFTQEQRSSRTHYKGTGLGMAITKKLVDQMHGLLDVESEPGKGSTFIGDPGSFLLGLF